MESAEIVLGKFAVRLQYMQQNQSRVGSILGLLKNLNVLSLPLTSLSLELLSKSSGANTSGDAACCAEVALVPLNGVNCNLRRDHVLAGELDVRDVVSQALQITCRLRT